MKTLKAILLASLFIFNSSVLAHTGIKSTFPENAQTLETSPEKITLTFKGNVRLMKVTLAGSDEKALETDFKPSAKPTKTFDITPSKLTSGEYTVHWVSMSKDGHKITGDFSFDVGSKDAESTKKVAESDEHKKEHHAH